MAEAIKIHYARDELLNSKNEYNANHLSRVVVEEDAFERKRNARQEEMRELEEKRNWERFKIGHKTRPKRKIVEENTVPEGWRTQ